MSVTYNQFQFASTGPDATHQFGYALGTLVRPGDVICLSGNLGAGKTALTRGIGAGWGAVERVTSPTFTLVHEHSRAQNGGVLFHVDCYRLAGPADADTIGLDDMLYGDGVVVIEWPERVAAALPEQRLWIRINMVGDSVRDFVCEAVGTRYDALLSDLRAWNGNAGNKAE